MASSITDPPSKRRRKNQIEKQPTETAIHSPQNQKKSPLVVFAHGAGAPSTSEWMIRWKQLLAKVLDAVEVVTFDYPYISGGKRRAPPKAEKLVEYHSTIVKEAVDKYPGHPLILVGKSMGSRVSCMVAGEDGIDASGIVCLGYPLKGINGSIRDEIILQLTLPIMFVQGSKDSLCPLDKLSAVRKKMNSINELHVVDGGDHSFKIAKKHLLSNGSTQEAAEDQASEAIADFVTNVAPQHGNHFLLTKCLGALMFAEDTLTEMLHMLGSIIQGERLAAQTSQSSLAAVKIKNLEVSLALIKSFPSYYF